MSKRLTRRFENLRARGEPALVGFLTAGDPDPETSLNILTAACQNGLDVLELGIPFSDPTVDGPVIQAASHRALRAGMTVAGALALAAELRRRTDVPIILFSYYNPLLQFGLPRLAAETLAADADGFLVVDLPPEESEEFTRHIPCHRLPLIRLVAPTTAPERIATIVQNAGGFLYLISRTGVTGGAPARRETIERLTARVRVLTPLPICVGFGIRTPAEAAETAAFADGVVVGSALVQQVASGLSEPQSLASRIGESVRRFEEALRPRTGR